MPNIKSAAKRSRSSIRKTMINKQRKSPLKTSIKKAEEAISSGNVENAQEAFVNAVKAIDKAVTKGILHKNTASRKKSALQKNLSNLIQK